jgi:hypothetical protein
MEAAGDWEWRTGHDCVALASLPAALALYGLQPGAEQQEAVLRAFDDLAALTDPDIGLQHLGGCGQLAGAGAAAGAWHRLHGAGSCQRGT